jgi:hypothetical protein
VCIELERYGVVKKLKGQLLYAALWMTGILAIVIASGAPNKL